ncbi:MAG: AAA family ATPase, partial [Prevotella sp.]|nr:AAA family ATPase [Prevotella sp.]
MDRNQSVFILKGYAGTGKTTLIKSIIPLIQEKGKSVLLMAPTGRAAKVLSEKTGHYASTIHRGIYAFDKLYVAHYDENGNLVKSSLVDENKNKIKKGVDDIQFFFS